MAEKKYGIKMAAKISQRIDQIASIDNVELMIQHRIGRCHPLSWEKGNATHIVQITEIIDYH